MLRRTPGSKTWSYQCTVSGKVWMRSTGKTDRKAAEKEVPRLEKLAELYRERPNKSPQLSQAIVKEVARVQSDVSENQAERVSASLRIFLDWCGDKPLEKIEAQTIEAYQRHRLKSSAQSTVKKDVWFLLRMLRLNGIALPPPPPKRGRVTEQREFTREEVERFFAACPAQCKVVFLLMLATGARPAELIPSDRSNHVALLKTEVDLEQCHVTIRSAKQRLGAKGKSRVLKLPQELVEPLRRQMESVPGPFVFQKRWNGPRDFDLILKKAGIPKIDASGRKVTAHSFRHTYATLMAEAVNENAYLLKTILGHSSIAMTDRYCHPERHAISPAASILSDVLAGTHVEPPCRVVEVRREEEA